MLPRGRQANGPHPPAPPESALRALAIRSLWDGRPALAAEYADLTLTDGGADLLVAIDAPFHGDPPPPHPVGRTPALWEHEVVELFIAGPGERYIEVEVGPRGHFLAYALDGVRRVVDPALPVHVVTAIMGGSWTARVRLPRALLPPGPHRANAYAIHGVGPSRRHLAAAGAPGPAPDFHRLDTFLPLELP